MKIAILAALIFIGVSSASPTRTPDEIVFPVSNMASCRIGDTATEGLDKKSMHDCLINYRNENWNGMSCGNRGWFKGGRSWDNPDHCYDGCADCISTAINMGANDVQCDQQVAFAWCWMGYH